MPIAVNMQQVNFRYGDYLQKEGEVPKGLYLIKSGQCNVCKVIVSSRKQPPAEVKSWQKRTNEKIPLLQNYNADNSLLNNVKLSSKVSQNARIFVTETGEQVEGEI